MGNSPWRSHERTDRSAAVEAGLHLLEVWAQAEGRPVGVLARDRGAVLLARRGMREVNIGVRTRPGVDGDIIVAAYCVVCDTEVMPSTSGRCLWCGLKVVGQTEPSKLCRRCDLELPRSEFQINSRTVDGLSAWCRGCFADYHADKRAGLPFVSLVRCRGCGCSLSERTPGCHRCTNRHWMRAKRSAA